MAEAYTIEAADGVPSIDPALLRELRDLLRADEDVDLGLKLKSRSPEPGEQGAIPFALEVLAAGAPVAASVAKVLSQWLLSRRVTLKITNGGGRSVELSAANAKDAESLLAALAEQDEAPGADPNTDADPDADADEGE